MKFATRLALAGVFAALACELVWSWYLQDLLLKMLNAKQITSQQVYEYHHLAATVKSVLQNGPLACFFFALQSRTYYLGEFN